MPQNVCEELCSLERRHWFYVRCAFDGKKLLPVEGTGCTAPLSSKSTVIHNNRSSKKETSQSLRY